MKTINPGRGGAERGTTPCSGLYEEALHTPKGAGKGALFVRFWIGNSLFRVYNKIGKTDVMISERALQIRKRHAVNLLQVFERGTIFYFISILFYSGRGYLFLPKLVYARVRD